MKEHTVKVYTTKEETENFTGYEDLTKVIEIDDHILILYHDDGLIEVWHENVIEKYHDDIEEYMDDECDEGDVYIYKYAYEFSLEKYLV